MSYPLEANSRNGAKKKPDLRKLYLPRSYCLLTTVAAILAATVYCLYLTFQLPASILPGYPGDGFFPRIALTMVLLFGAIIILREVYQAHQSNRHPAETDEQNNEVVQINRPVELDVMETVSVVILGIGYISMLDVIGFEIATVSFMFVLLLPRIILPLPKAILASFAGAVTTMVFAYSAFVIGLNVQLPLKYLPAYIQ